MKNTFRGFYTLSDEELKLVWNSDKTLFVFDTSILLSLYGWEKQTRTDFYNILNKLDDRIWLPYQVALEYQLNRLAAVKAEKKVFSTIGNSLNKFDEIFENDFANLNLEKRFPKIFSNTEKLKKEILESVEKYKKLVNKWDDLQPCVRSHDEIREIFDKCFEGRIGDKPQNQDVLSEMYKTGEIRYENRIPPGYEDVSKENSDNEFDYSYGGLKYKRKFGDLILWLQIIDKAKDSKISNVIFITNDMKKDWWYQLNSNGNKIVGPQAELREEIINHSEIDVFHMYNASKFMEDSKENLEVEVEDRSIKDAVLIKESSNNSEFITTEQKVNLKDLREDLRRVSKHLKASERLRFSVDEYDEKPYKLKRNLRRNDYNRVEEYYQVFDVLESINPSQKQKLVSQYDIRQIRDMIDFIGESKFVGLVNSDEGMEEIEFLNRRIVKRKRKFED